MEKMCNAPGSKSVISDNLVSVKIVKNVLNIHYEHCHGTVGLGFGTPYRVTQQELEYQVT